MPRGLRITGYTLLWLTLVALFGAGVWWAVTHGKVTSIEPGELRSLDAPPEQTPGASIGDKLGMTDLGLRGMDMTVSAANGRMKMHVWAEKGQKTANLYDIQQGALQFSLGDKDTLILKVNNVTYKYEAGVVRVKGSLVGYIPEGQQYFKAEELSWDTASDQVRTEEVRYVSPDIEVSGQRMSVDLATGTIHFEGPVEVGI